MLVEDMNDPGWCRERDWVRGLSKVDSKEIISASALE